MAARHNQLQVPFDTVLVTDFNFDLPADLIAQHPLHDRSGARMLALDRRTGEWRDSFFRDLPGLLHAGDLLVLNDSRVIPARLFAQRGPRTNPQPPDNHQPKGKIEVLLTEQQSETDWQALVRPGRKVGIGEKLLFYENNIPEPVLTAEVIARGEFGARTLRFNTAQNFFSILDRIGNIPLPPYIHRKTPEGASGDRDRYQTVYARDRGSVAAPTAGLHFTPSILEALQSRGVRIAFVTLHVGLGTFAPLRVEQVEQVRLHAERYTLPQQTAAELNSARGEGRRIVAVGTTTVRTLEHCALTADGAPLLGHSGSTSIFIAPGFQFRLVAAMLTNFHLPQSSLLMLVSAFAGRENVLAAYRQAVASRYRFFSYGDCMWIA